jgi:hypothetical protein
MQECFIVIRSARLRLKVVLRVSSVVSPQVVYVRAKKEKKAAFMIQRSRSQKRPRARHIPNAATSIVPSVDQFIMSENRDKERTRTRKTPPPPSPHHAHPTLESTGGGDPCPPALASAPLTAAPLPPPCSPPRPSLPCGSSP